MDEKNLIEALLEGPRNQRDLPGTPAQLEEIARSRRHGGAPILSWGGGVFALTPAGYAYAEQAYGLKPKPEPNDDLQRSLDSLVGTASGPGGNGVRYLQFLGICVAIGFGLSAVIYVINVWRGYWPL